MIPYNEIVKRLKNLGYSENENISDFWFANKDQLIPKLYGKRIHDSRIGLQVRWKSEIGIICQTAIKEYILYKIKSHQEKKIKEFIPNNFDEILKNKEFKHRAINTSDLFLIIDLKDFRFEFQNRMLTIDDFEYRFPMERSNYTDLSGIDFSGIKINNCTFKNIAFSCVNFDNSNLSQINFDNCNLGNCSFRNAKLSHLNLKNTMISGNFEGSVLFNIKPFNDTTIHSPFIIKRISYFKLLYDCISALFAKKTFVLKNENHTRFSNIATKELELPNNIELKNYIEWYQKSYETPHASFNNRFSHFLAVLLTKNWTSFTVLAVWFLLINIFFSFAIYFGQCHFNLSGDLFKPDIFQSFYYSIITFSILGYGDLVPIDNWGRLLILCEAVIGYIILGLSIFLLSRKIEKKI
jgi:uncharacterized protein YjbI with pentapeptide repeats